MVLRLNCWQSRDKNRLVVLVERVVVRARLRFVQTRAESVELDPRSVVSLAGVCLEYQGKARMLRQTCLGVFVGRGSGHAQHNECRDASEFCCQLAAILTVRGDKIGFNRRAHIRGVHATCQEEIGRGLAFYNTQR